MLKRILPFLLGALLVSNFVHATNPDSLQADSVALERYHIEQGLQYQTGTIDLAGVASIKVPKGFKFLDAAQSKQVLTTLWNNPPDESTLGLLFPENMSPLSDSFTYVVEISYSEEGYIKDDDAEDINYDDLLEEMQKDAQTANEERQKAGYGSVELVGWAAPPYYDKESKKLHWAKEIKFDGAEANTLNYNIRVLGRKGYLVLNVISDIAQLEAVKPEVNTILASVEFKDGSKYSDFDPELDKVAAYGVGGLIAGKVLAKVGFFALIAKFWKFILMGIIAGGAGLRKLFFGGKSKEEQLPAQTPSEETPVQ